MKSSPATTWRTGAGRTALGVLCLALTACGSGSVAASSRVAARVGDIEIIDPYLPNPASPSVAAVYLTVRNTGSTPDALIGASSAIAASASLHTELVQGSYEVMVPLVRLDVSAHGQASLVPGHDHVMLEGLNQVLEVGQTVKVTLRFADAGQVAVPVLVVPLDSVVDGMGNMPGMGGT